MAKANEIRRYALYGEGNQAIAPEFLHIETIWARSSQNDWTIAPHAHPAMVQIFVLQDGGGELVEDGARSALVPLSLIAVPAGAIHAFHFEEGAQGWVLSLAQSLLHDGRISQILPALPFVRGEIRRVALAPDAPFSQRLILQITDFADAIARGGVAALRPSLLAQLALVLTLVGEALAQGQSVGPQRAGHDRLVMRFHDLVEGHFRDHWNVDRYASLLSTTVPTLNRACKAVAGKSPGQIIHDRQVLEAMRMLTFTLSNVTQISEALGFSDPAYFARFFKSATGLTASAFRIRNPWLA